MTLSNAYDLVEHAPPKVSSGLIDQLMVIAESAFGYPMPREEVENASRHASKLLVVYSKDTPIAFASYKMLDARFAYLSGSCVHDDYKDMGIYGELVDKRIEMLTGSADFVSTRTQNPVIYRAFERSVSDLHPKGDAVSDDILEMARMVDGRVGRNMIVRGCYGRQLALGSFGVRNEKESRMFGKLNMAKGDAYVLIGRICGVM